MHNRFWLFILVGLLIMNNATCSHQSITGNHSSYIEACRKAVNDPLYFQNFRSTHEYASNVECYGFGNEFAQYLLTNASPQTLEKLEQFRRLDQYGNPLTKDIEGVGRFSETTLRYIIVADQIKELFNLPSNPKIVEIGAGFGGQCYILSQIQIFSDYFIYDLPDVENLIEKMLKTLSIERVSLIPQYVPLPESNVDLLISNYAFSECDRQTQLDYFERVLKKADRGYMLFNQLHVFDSLSLAEFVKLLEDNNMKPQLYEEPVLTYKDNVLVTWDKTN